jgi:hypothetical protein
MMEGQIFEAIISRLQQQKSDIELFLANGGAKNYEEYCRMVGEYTSLLKTEGDIKDIEQRFLDN